MKTVSKMKFRFLTTGPMQNFGEYISLLNPEYHKMFVKLTETLSSCIFDDDL